MTQTPYQHIGGEKGVRAIVDAFYTEMDRHDDARAIRAMHPADISQSNEKLFMYFSGWLGGPPLFENAYGHPRLRQRHMGFTISPEHADAWLGCMERALASLDLDRQFTDWFMTKLRPLAHHMVNH